MFGFSGSEYPQRASGVTVQTVTLSPQQVRDHARMERMGMFTSYLFRAFDPERYNRMYQNWQAVNWVRQDLGRPTAYESDYPRQRQRPAWHSPLENYVNRNR